MVILNVVMSSRQNENPLETGLLKMLFHTKNIFTQCQHALYCWGKSDCRPLQITCRLRNKRQQKGSKWIFSDKHIWAWLAWRLACLHLFTRCSLLQDRTL